MIEGKERYHFYNKVPGHNARQLDLLFRKKGGFYTNLMTWDEHLELQLVIMANLKEVNDIS